MKFILPSTFIIASHLSSMAQAGTPSFDCKKSTSQIEKAICSDSELGDLDNELSKKFQGLRKRASKSVSEKLLASEKSWLVAGRNCRRFTESEAKIKRCAKQAYVNRIKALEVTKMKPFEFVLVGQDYGPYIFSPRSKDADAFNAYADAKGPFVSETEAYDTELSFVSSKVISLFGTNYLNEGVHPTWSITTLKFSPALQRELREGDVFKDSAWKERFKLHCWKQLKNNYLSGGQLPQDATISDSDEEAKNREIVAGYVEDFSNLGITRTGFETRAGRGDFPFSASSSCDFPLSLFADQLTKFGREIFQAK